MKWYEKFKVGQKVTVVKKILRWKYYYAIDWNREGDMDSTIGGTFTINEIDKEIGYCLSTGNVVSQDYWYPAESLACVKGEQLLFSFMD